MFIKKKNLRPEVVLIGPMPIEGDVIGGTKVSFSDLVRTFLSQKRFDISVINTSRPHVNKGAATRSLLNFRSLLHTVLVLWTQLRHAKIVIWNVSSSAALSAGPLIWLICKVRHRPLVVRVFGGDFNAKYVLLPRLKKKIVEYSILKADMLLLQTRELVRCFSDVSNVRWFPTTRNMPSRVRPTRKKCRRLVFVGQLRKEKGIQEIVDASKLFLEGVSVTIFGPKMVGLDITFDKIQNIEYAGVIEPDTVPIILQNYDMLLFPSYYEGEGYPGIVIEALQLGLPVISTNWKALPEIIEDGKSGLLVKPRSVTDLVNAVNTVVRDDKLFMRLTRGACERGEVFRSSKAAENIELLIHELI